MDATQTGMMYYQEIEAIRVTSNGRWRWEKQIYCPNQYDVNTICQIAGCWCDVPSGNVKLYANENHPAHGGRPAGW